MPESQATLQGVTFLPQVSYLLSNLLGRVQFSAFFPALFTALYATPDVRCAEGSQG